MADPVITSLNPTSGPVGTSVHILGRNFSLISQGDPVAPTVACNGVAWDVLSYSGSNIYAQVPPGATTGNVIVSTLVGQSNGVLFTVTPPTGIPDIASINPVAGPPGTLVTITGTNFGSSQNTSTVTFNGVLANVVSWSATSIVTSVPATATTGPVLVTVGGTPSNSIVFTVVAASNGGTSQPLNLLLIPGLNFNNPALWTLDPTNFDDPNMGGVYSWKVEDVIAGRTPTLRRVIISYRDLGIASFTLVAKGTDDSGSVVGNSVSVQVGTSKASQRICTIIAGLELAGQNLQVMVSRSPGSGPLSITKLRLEGTVETTVY